MSRILVLGASYGLLPGVKLSQAGHDVTFVGRGDEIAAMAKGDLAVRIPMVRSDADAVIRDPNCAFATPDSANVQEADFVILAMQEPQLSDPIVAKLLGRVARSGKPCLSIMNLPPPPFLERCGVSGSVLEGVFSKPEIWADFDTALITNASPDPQALRMDAEAPGELTVTLASNFKVAPFADAESQVLLERLARDFSRATTEVEGALTRTPVKMLAHSSVFVPLTKWPMLIAGNCRCLTDTGIRTITEAVLSDRRTSRDIYDAVAQLVVTLGAREDMIVPFDQYAKAAESLTRPSSAARALANGAKQIERIDRLVLNLMEDNGVDCAAVGQINEQISSRLRENRK